MRTISRMKPSEAFEQHRETIRRLVHEHGMSNPRLFGSALHGDDTRNQRPRHPRRQRTTHQPLRSGSPATRPRRRDAHRCRRQAPGRIPPRLPRRGSRRSGPRMSKRTLGPRLYVEDMLQYCRLHPPVHERDHVGVVPRTTSELQFAVIRALEVLGEAAKRLSDTAAKRRPSLRAAAIARDLRHSQPSHSRLRNAGSGDRLGDQQDGYPKAQGPSGIAPRHLAGGPYLSRVRMDSNSLHCSEQTPCKTQCTKPSTAT